MRLNSILGKFLTLLKIQILKSEKCKSDMSIEKETYMFLYLCLDKWFLMVNKSMQLKVYLMLIFLFNSYAF